jgi:hypothetical protein
VKLRATRDKRSLAPVPGVPFGTGHISAQYRDASHSARAIGALLALVGTSRSVACDDDLDPHQGNGEVAWRK